MAIRALIFDFDGLIIDTETPEVEVWRDVFAEHEVEYPDAYWMNVIGRGAEQITETPPQLLARLASRPIDIAKVHKDARGRVMDRILKQPPRPGIVNLLEGAKAEGLALGVASSSRHSWVDGFLERLGLLSYFDSTTCADDVDRAKPFPDLYLLACARLHVDPSEAIALEDSANGIAAARAAGVFVVAYPNSVTQFLDLSAANHRIDDLSAVTLSDLTARIPE